MSDATSLDDSRSEQSKTDVSQSETTVPHGGTDTEEDHNEFSRIADDEKQTVTMAVEVDVSDMETEDVKRIKALSKLYEDSFLEVVQKNRGYGFSFLQVGAERANLPGGPFDNEVRAIADGLFTRTKDKRSRFHQMMFTEAEGASSDPLWQTAAENANYWLFMALITKHPDLAKIDAE
jgi:hypothetical protein